ncbi:hypothetical protein E1B28_013843 [Marasmius oreades]|uniref:DNA polymerase epsilon catalytic subunit n=1 Tax=Marasmius oreades TaxID=181124 RepID=A0A9P7RLV0_9AGAR|nr:uncharacterized protein E1B28_013843 [Marasmius oreades]KAG7085303.1 hypothetical protein E1B28_013843 [Marasmius oreades]
MPNKHEEEHGNFYDDHLLASETYVGGHVEALEAGVFRSDISTDFKITPSAVEKLIGDLDATLTFCIVEESKASLDDVTNYDQVKSDIQSALETLRDNPKRTDSPLIYHLDFAAILRGEFFPAHHGEYNMIRHALNQESFPQKRPGGPERRYTDLTPTEQAALMHKRLGDYSRKVYKKDERHKSGEECQRENPFYVDTVRRFRDRRYEYKGLLKTWKKTWITWSAKVAQ